MSIHSENSFFHSGEIHGGSANALTEIGANNFMSGSALIRVMLADDETLVRQAFAALIDGAADMTVAAEASGSANALRLHSQVRPDVVLVNLHMAHSAGLELIRLIRRADPHARVLAISAVDSDIPVVAALRAGANGLISKDGKLTDLLTTIREIHAGNTVLCRSAAHDLISFVVRTPQSFDSAIVDSCHGLTPGELSVVNLLAQGLTNAEIALKLHLSEATIKTRFSKIMGKWGVKTRVQVAVRAVRLGVVALCCLGLALNLARWPN